MIDSFRDARVVLVVVLVVVTLGSYPARAGTATTLVSRSPSGDPGAGDSTAPSIAADGTRIAFLSAASDLVPEDTNGAIDAFVYESGTVTRVSLRRNGRQASKGAREAVLSPDGLHVALVTSARLTAADEDRAADVYVRTLGTGATTLVSSTAREEAITMAARDAAVSDRATSVAFTTTAPVHRLDRNGVDDVYVKNTATGATPIISLAADGTDADGPSRHASIEAGGRLVAFESDATDLVDPDTNGTTDIFVRDRGSKQTYMVSVSSQGVAGNGPSFNPYIAPNGRYVVYESDASNLVPSDDNGHRDVFLHDLATRQTTRISVTSEEGQLDGPSTDASVSSDGHFVVFVSAAPALVGDGSAQAFLRDLLTGATRALSTTADGQLADGVSRSPVVSGDASLVTFTSTASNLVPDHTGSFEDVYVRSPY